jgi:lipopolysaccharide transport system ATP-binding protein
MSFDFAIQAKNLGKCYQIYDRPVDRLKQSFWRGRKRFYREFWALRDVFLEIKKGETVGIIGSNGAGKSTLLQLICGTLNQTEGEVIINGRTAALLELGAGFNPEFTGRENIYINAAIMGLTRAEIDSRYDEIADFADIGSFIEQPVKTYSSGMYVRLAFATAINVSPDILLVDETLAVGDVRFQQKCMAKIRKFCQSGTVIFVTHDTTAVTELCSRVIWIESGRVQMDGLPKFVVEQYFQFMHEEDVGFKTVVSDKSVDSASNFDMNGFPPIGDNIRQFGDRRVTIEAVHLISRGFHNGVVYAGQACEIGMVLHAHEDIANPVAGFIVKDRLGREILSDNTNLIKQDFPALSGGQSYVITFRINEWPNLQEGDYSLSVAIANGTSNENVQCHHLHDAVIFKSIPVRAHAGIFSVPDIRVGFFQEDD